MEDRRTAGLSRASADSRATGTSRVRVLTVVTGLGAVLGAAGLAWGVAPHPSAATGTPEGVTDTPAAGPTTVPTTSAPAPNAPTPNAPVVGNTGPAPAPVATSGSS